MHLYSVCVPVHNFDIHVHTDLVGAQQMSLIKRLFTASSTEDGIG